MCTGTHLAEGIAGDAQPCSQPPGGPAISRLLRPFEPPHLLGLLQALLELRLLLLHFALPLLDLLQLDLVLLQFLQLGLVFIPLHLEGLQLLLQVPYLATQVLLLLGGGAKGKGESKGPPLHWQPTGPAKQQLLAGRRRQDNLGSPSRKGLQLHQQRPLVASSCPG